MFAYDACGSNSFADTCAEASDTLAVRCCADDGACGGSVCDASAATLAEAATACEAQGLRLCTADELANCGAAP